MIDKKELQAIAQASAKNIKTEEDLNEFRQMLPKSRSRQHSTLNWMIIQALPNMNSPKRVIAATALLARPCKRKMASLNWILHEKERAALNPDWLKSTSVDLPQWRGCNDFRVTARVKCIPPSVLRTQS